MEQDAAPPPPPPPAAAANNLNNPANNNGSTTTTTPPLLLLLDGSLSQDAIRVDAALRQLSLFAMQHHATTPPSHPLTVPWVTGTELLASPLALYRLLDALLQPFPFLAGQASTHDGSLPLHFAASLGDVNVARLLYERFPAAAATPNAKGKIPLHYAAREGRLAMVHYLLAQHPGTAQIASHKFKLALHFAAGEGHLDVCRLLLQCYPRGAALPSAKGKVALHFCARWGHVALAQELLHCYPDGVRALDWEGSLPLHDAARQGQVEVSQWLLHVFPGAAAVTNLRTELPLFPAVRSGCVPLVRLLLRAWPSGAQSVLQNVSADDNLDEWTDEMLDLLLRGAVGAPLPEEDDGLEEEERTDELRTSDRDGIDAVDILHAAADTTDSESWNRKRPAVNSDTAVPGTVNAKCPLDLDGPAKRAKVNVDNGAAGDGGPSSSSAHHSSASVFLPLHAALQCGASVPVLHRVVRDRLHDATRIDASGRTPLHWAVCRTQELGVVQVGKSLKSKKKKAKTPVCNRVDLDLIQRLAVPDAARFRDSNRCLPLHLALQHRVGLPILDCLLEAHPAVAGEPCGTNVPGECPLFKPIHLACQYDCDTDVVFRLLRLDPSVLDGPRSA